MAEIGHNSRSEDEKKFLFFYHMRKRMAHNGVIDAANTSKKADAKTAKADGVDIGNLDFAIKALSAEDKNTIADRFMIEGEILTWLEVLPGFQADLLRDRAPQAERIENKGHLAGLAGSARFSGYEEGSDDDRNWKNGYDKGQKFMQEQLQKDMERRNAKSSGEQSDHADDVDFPEGN